MKEKEAVSPVIGVILMVAITVVLAAIVYLWVIGFFGMGKQTPVLGGSSSAGPGDYKYKVTITSGSTEVKTGKYYILDTAGIVVANGTVDEIYSKEKDEGGVKFIDNNYDGKISTNDVFLIKSPPASVGYRLVLKHAVTDGIMLDVTLW